MLSHAHLLVRRTVHLRVGATKPSLFSLVVESGDVFGGKPVVGRARFWICLRRHHVTLFVVAADQVLNPKRVSKLVAHLVSPVREEAELKPVLLVCTQPAPVLVVQIHLARKCSNGTRC